MSEWVLFEDGGGRLTPICDLRAAFELRTGALTTAERLAGQLGRPPAALVVPDELAPLVGARHPMPVNRLPKGDAFTFINGRWTRIHLDLPDRPNAALVDSEGAVVAAVLDRERSEAFVASGGRVIDGVETITATDAQMIRRPWHVLQHAEANLDHDLAEMAGRLEPLRASPAPRVTVVGERPVLIGEGTVVHPHVVFDTSAGPIAIDDGAEVRSMSVVVGPAYIGPGSAVTNHAHLRGHSVIGPVCKVGGEINRSIFQGHANKAHSGYLGNSFVGEWVNLGADTVTSNLKNTYGEIRMRVHPAAPAEPTGTSHLGSIIGDHVKTAIGTRLLTGTSICTGAMLAVSGFPPKYVQPFAFLTEDGEQRYDFDKFCQVARTMMDRRGLSISAELRARLRQLYDSAQPA